MLSILDFCQSNHEHWFNFAFCLILVTLVLDLYQRHAARESKPPLMN